MNARLYDPRIGRFFSPDNYITDAENPQNYNRYSYALNNPLSYVDPSGNVPIPMYGGNAAGSPDCTECVITATMGNLQNLYAITCAMQYLLMSPGTMIELSARDLLDGFIPYSFYADAQYDKSNWRRGKLPLDLTFDEGSIWLLSPEGQEKVKKEHEQMELNYDIARAQLESDFPDYEISFGVKVIPASGYELARKRNLGEFYIIGLAQYKTNKLFIDDYTLLNNISRPGYGWEEEHGHLFGVSFLQFHQDVYQFTLTEALVHETFHFYGYQNIPDYKNSWTDVQKERYAIGYTNYWRRIHGYTKYQQLP